MRLCPKCETPMILWERGRPGKPAWRCPACHRIRRKDRHNSLEIQAVARDNVKPADVDVNLGTAATEMTHRILALADSITDV